MNMRALTFALISIALFNGCKKDDSPDKDNIVGKWKLDRFMAYSGKDGSVLEEEKVNACSAESYYEFLADHTGKENTAMGNGASDCDQWIREIKNYAYDPSAKILAITFDDFETDYEIFKLTNNELEVEAAREDSDINNDGVEDKFSNIYRK